jgi:hypothetical protein
MILFLDTYTNTGSLWDAGTGFYPDRKFNAGKNLRVHCVMTILT